MASDKRPDSAEADRDLLQRVNDSLHQSGFGPLRKLAIGAERGVVVVQGSVPAFYLRQIAVECIKRVAGVTQVVDRIEVVGGPVHFQATDSPEGEQESPDDSSRHRVDFPDVT